MEKITADGDREEDATIGSPSSEGKMVIKLKIPKLTPAMEGERSSEVLSSMNNSNQGKKVCTECKKEFSSGKALGGHMRIHVQAANRNTFLKPSKTTKFKKCNQDFNNGDHGRKPSSNYRSSVNDEGKPTCSICRKIFPSMKSLFGHMRCHPERLWRGILPPPNTPIAAVYRRTVKPTSPPSVSPSSNSTSSVSENRLNLNYEEGSNVLEDAGDQVVDLTKFLRGWTVTERRGRRALRAADEDDVLREAVEDLMSLANGGPSSMADSDVTQKQLREVAEVFEGSNSNGIDEKPSPSNDVGLTAEYGKGKAVMEEEKPVNTIENFSDNESDSRNTNEQMVVSYKGKNPNKIKKRKKMKLVMELEQGFTAEMVVGGGGGGGGGPTPPQYKCTTCNKSFTSHQALGGHRSSHNKSKITPTDHNQVEEDDYHSFIMNQTSDNVEKEVEFAGDATAAVVVAAAGGSHQCKICDKIFPTGQALGGHKRCHWTATPIEAQAPSSQVTSTGETASQTDGGGRRRILDFDLNEVPPAAMMEDEAGNGVANGNRNGYASSSYNSNMG